MNKIGGCHPEGQTADTRNERREETSIRQEEWRGLLREARAKKVL